MMTATMTVMPRAARFASIAAPERQRLAPSPWLLGFALAVALALVAAYPGRSLEDRLSRYTVVDPVSLAYLNAWLRAKPDDYSLRLVLARQLLAEGELAKVAATLDPMLQAHGTSVDERTEAHLMMVAVRQRQLWQLKPGSPEFMAARQLYLEQLRSVALLDWWDESRLLKFASDAQALNDNSLARQLYWRLILRNPAGGLSRYDSLARIDLADGNYREAASIYLRALPYTVGRDQRRQYFLHSLQTLTAGNLLDEAVRDGMNNLGPLADDDQTLSYLVHLALADRRVDVAARLTARLLHQQVNFGEGVG